MSNFVIFGFCCLERETSLSLFAARWFTFPLDELHMMYASMQMIRYRKSFILEGFAV